MTSQITENNGRITKIYYCPHLKTLNSIYRKPNVGMALAAKKDFPDINFKNSFMVGDSLSDMIFGKRMKMKTVFIGNDINMPRRHPRLIDLIFVNLFNFANYLNTTENEKIIS